MFADSFFKLGKTTITTNISGKCDIFKQYQYPGYTYPKVKNHFKDSIQYTPQVKQSRSKYSVLSLFSIKKIFLIQILSNIDNCFKFIDENLGLSKEMCDSTRMHSF